MKQQTTKGGYMQSDGIRTARRLLSIIGCIILSIYFIRTEFDMIPTFILLSSLCFYLAVSIDLYAAKKELIVAQSKKISTKNELIKKHYSNDINLDHAFIDCLEKAVYADQQNKRISKILGNYRTSNHRFKLNLKRPAENRLDPNNFKEF